jgi:hypothetical protein
MPSPDPQHGPVRGHVRSTSWAKVSHGLYKPASDTDGLPDDLAAWKLVLPPSGRFTHLTAARLYGWWLPPLPLGLPVFASMSKDESRPRRPGLRVSRHPLAPPGRELRGLPVASPAEVLLACARDLGLLDVVVLVEAAVHLGWCSADELLAACATRRYGAPALLRALGFVDGRAESPWEVLLRILHVVCGIDVEPQHVLLDEQGGFVARGDLWIKGTTTLHEYDGAPHREKRQHRKDLARERRIGDTAWTRRGYTDVEVLTQAASIIRDADRSLGRPHLPDRARPWYDLLATSMFSGSGMARARRRWGLPHVGGHELRDALPRKSSS